MAELRRVFSRRLLLILLALLVCNLVLFYRQERSGRLYDRAAYAAAYEEALAQAGQGSPEQLLARNEEQRAQLRIWREAWMLLELQERSRDYFRMMLENYRELAAQEDEYALAILPYLEGEPIPLSQQQTLLQTDVREQISSQLSYFIDYPLYLERIREQADQMSRVSLFSDPRSFAYKNIQKTVRDFSRMEGASLTLGKDRAVERLFDDRVVDYSILLFELLICASFLTERRRGLWSLVHAAPAGRAKLALVRVGILLAGAAVGTAVLLGGKTLLSGWLYGGYGDTSRLIQSIEAFRGVTRPTSVRAFFLSYFVMKILGTFLVGLCLWLVLSAVQNTGLAFGAAALFLAAEYAMFTLIRDSWALVPLRYANVFAFVEFGPIYRRYLNISVLGWVTDARMLTVGLLPVLLLLTGALCVLVQVRKYPEGARSRLELILDRARRQVSLRLDGRLHAFGFELYKILWLQKGIVILALGIWLTFQMTAPHMDTTRAQRLEASYAAQLSEESAEDALTRIGTRRETTEEQLAQMAGAGGGTGSGAEASAASQALLDELEALNLLEQRIGRCAQLGEETGVPGQLLNDLPYRTLVADEAAGEREETALKALLVLVLLLAGAGALENAQGMHALQTSVRQGHSGLARRQILAGVLLAAAVFVLFYGRELFLVTRTYGALTHLSAPAASVEELSLLPGGLSRMPLGGFLAAFYGLRLVSLTALALCVLCLSGLLRRTDQAVVIQIAVWLLPPALVLMGLRALVPLTFLSPLEAAGLWMHGRLWAYLIPAMLGAAAAAVTVRRRPK